MPALPGGTVTFLFTDVEGSTALWERKRAAMAVAIERHEHVLHAAIAAQGGTVFKTVGDAFCAAFDRAQDALKAAVAAQRELSAADWSMLGDDDALRVRMAVHTGEAEERNGDYFGPPVNRVARLMAVGRGGQILVSLATQQITRGRLPEDCRLHDWGEHRLRDLRHAEHIFQLLGPGWPAVEAPPRSAGRAHPRERVRITQDRPAAGATDASPAGVRPVPEPASQDRRGGVPEGLWAQLVTALRAEEDQAVELSPLDAKALAGNRAASWLEWHVGRVAEWSHPRYRLDGRFVGLTLLVDRGNLAHQGRWQAQPDRFTGLDDLLADVDDPAIVLLGPPGSGKSTLLRRLELDRSIAALRREEAGTTLFAPLSSYTARGQDHLLEPGAWLAERWASRAPGLPPLDTMLADGGVTLLLDGLNEIPGAGEVEFHERIRPWRDWLQRLVEERPGNRVVIACRSLDYSQPLSTPTLRVPQVRIEPLSDEQVREFLEVYLPARWREVWAELAGRSALEVFRSPYFLALLVEQVEVTGTPPPGRAALFTGLIRQALRREVEAGHPLFEAGALLSRHDMRRITQWRWRDEVDLPDRGLLVPQLCQLACGMQPVRGKDQGSTLRIDARAASTLLEPRHAEAVLAAGAALAVLDEDAVTGELMFVHQLVQEYFAARALAFVPEAAVWREAGALDTARTDLQTLVEGLGEDDPLPPLPQNGWEETILLAAAMAEDPDAFVHHLAARRPILAARCATQADVAERISAACRDRLRDALLSMMDDAAVDLRARIAAGLALGDLGDPRFESRAGRDGVCLLPPLVDIPGGACPIGTDEPVDWEPFGLTTKRDDPLPRHEVRLAPFRLGRFPVTNAEFAHFVAAGGYEDDRWWRTEAARAWRRGELADESAKINSRTWRGRFLEDTALLERQIEDGRFVDDEAVARWRAWMRLDDEAFESALRAFWRGSRCDAPRYWRDDRFNHPSQPVVGVSWWEADAYCAWLGAQTGWDMRLPTEAEWEHAARGMEGRRYAYGDTWDPWSANVRPTHVRRTTPVGAFPTGRTPEGVDDLVGNVFEWTSSLYGDLPQVEQPTTFAYPYDAADGREDPATGPTMRRVERGGSWFSTALLAQAVVRHCDLPEFRDFDSGFRVAVDGASV